jgi:hypothetical protein
MDEEDEYLTLLSKRRATKGVVLVHFFSDT